MKVVLALCALLCLNTHLSAQTNPLLDALPPCNFEAGDNVRIGAVLFNFDTAEGCVQNLDERFAVASVPKLFIAGAYFEQVAAGTAKFNTPITFQASYLMDDQINCPTALRPSDVGREFTTGFLSEIMISCSDNSATWMLMDAIGWWRVEDYIARMGIEGVGPVIPYSEVDRLKLTFLDPQWANVPAGLAARFYRRDTPSELVPAYFSTMPSYSTEALRQANAQYFAEYDYNTATPRAIADYIIQLRADALGTDVIRSQIAWWMFNTMLLTQRQYSAQAFPGTVYIGAKNGFDIGVVAEVNAIFASLDNRIPQAIAIIFTQQDDLTASNVQLPNRRNGFLNQYLTNLSPRIVAWLYPDLQEQQPIIIPTPQLAVVRFGPNTAIAPCWAPYFASNFAESQVEALAACWRGQNSIGVPMGDELAMGLALNNLNSVDTRLTFIYTAPNGQRYSYQREVFSRDKIGIYWLHTPEQRGYWQIDIYLNLQRIYTETVYIS